MTKHPFYSTEIFYSQEMFDSMYKNFAWFITISKNFEVMAVFNYLPSLKDLSERGEYICPIKTKLIEPEINDFTVNGTDVVYAEGHYEQELEAKRIAKSKEVNNLIEQLPEQEGGIIKQILGYGKPNEQTNEK